MRQLPVAARVYVGAVIAGGALLFVALFPVRDFNHPEWFITLLLLSSITSAFKVTLPLARSVSSMSVSYAVDFLSLILLGPAQTMIVGSISAWSQCTFRMTTKNPPYRTLFSMASLVISVQAAGAAFHFLGGIPGLESMSLTAMAKPLIGAAGAYFVCNTMLIATAIALSTHQPVLRVWHQNFLWSAPNYFVGAIAAAGVSIVIGGTSNYWIALLAAPPLYLTYRSYKIYLGRIEDEQRHVREVSDLHLATIEALALAIDAKDRTGKSHIRRVQVFAAGLAKAIGMTPERDSGRQDRRAAPRHRQARGPRAHSLEARAPDAGRIPEDPDPSAGRRRNHRRCSVSVSCRAAHPEPPRALGRQGLSGGHEGRGDSCRRAHSCRRRLLRRADVRAPLSQGDER